MSQHEKSLSEYQAFLKDKHDRLFNTPDEVVGSAVKEATGSSLIQKDRIIKGEAHEVYDIKTESGREVIIRISLEKEPKFEKEKWVIEQCAKIGVPVPEIVYLKNIELEDRPLAICIENKIPGKPFNELPELFTPDMASELSDLMKQSGEILSQINSISIDGFGELDKTGKGEFESISEVLLNDDCNEQEMLRVATNVDLDPNVILQALEILKKGAIEYQPIKSMLVHNDYSPKHILVDQGRITGILDFEIAEGGDPIREFARWEFFYGDSYPLEPFREGYANKAIFAHDFELKLHLWKVYLGIVNLHYYEDEKHPPGIKMTKEKLINDVLWYTSKS
jgi:aminoglycoside phosphotransferase (APT) family kinase protein